MRPEPAEPRRGLRRSYDPVARFAPRSGSNARRRRHRGRQVPQGRERLPVARHPGKSSADTAALAPGRSVIFDLLGWKVSVRTRSVRTSARKACGGVDCCAVNGWASAAPSPASTCLVGDPMILSVATRQRLTHAACSLTRSPMTVPDRLVAAEVPLGSWRVRIKRRSRWVLSLLVGHWGRPGDLSDDDPGCGDRAGRTTTLRRRCSGSIRSVTSTRRHYSARICS